MPFTIRVGVLLVDGETGLVSRQFEPGFRDELVELFRWRRDVRRFRAEAPPPDAVTRLFGLANLAPSVGLSQPWRLVLVESREARAGVRASFELCNKAALCSQSAERSTLYAKLKLAGLEDAPCQFAVFADASTTQGHGLGRATMPRTIEYSTVMAISIIWLAARAEGLGLGWVSILDPDDVKRVLDVPPTWTFVGYFCLGYPVDEDDVPELERARWESRRPQPIIRR
jgi:5,6-dimethylbenzimidazole synthase